MALGPLYEDVPCLLIVGDNDDFLRSVEREDDRIPVLDCARDVVRGRQYPGAPEGEFYVFCAGFDLSGSGVGVM